MNSKVNELLDVAKLRPIFKENKSDCEIRKLISNKIIMISLFTLPTMAFAGDPVTIVNNFVNVLIGRVFPVMALGYFAHALMLFIKDDPTAKTKIVNVVLSSSFLIGINGVWRFIQSQAN
jgi:hypothetical protein